MEKQLIIYLVVAYWAYGVVNRNRIEIYSDWGKYFVNRVICAMFLGWIYIPVAIVKIIIGK